jgi:hypothetical protein
MEKRGVCERFSGFFLHWVKEEVGGVGALGVELRGSGDEKTEEGEWGFFLKRGG